MKCEECIFWEEDKSTKPANGVIMGYCRKNPPSATACVVPKPQIVTGKIIPTLVEITVWSKTRATAWCGGFIGAGDKVNERLGPAINRALREIQEEQ